MFLHHNSLYQMQTKHIYQIYMSMINIKLMEEVSYESKERSGCLR